MDAGLTSCPERHVTFGCHASDQVTEMDRWLADLRLSVQWEMQLTDSTLLLQLLRRFTIAITDAINSLQNMRTCGETDQDDVKNTLFTVKYRILLYKEQYQLMKALLPTVRAKRKDTPIPKNRPSLLASLCGLCSPRWPGDLICRGKSYTIRHRI